jgi:hypothetical protein
MDPLLAARIDRHVFDARLPVQTLSSDERAPETVRGHATHPRSSPPALVDFVAVSDQVHLDQPSFPVKRVDDAEISDAQLEEPIQAPARGLGAYDIDVSA